MKEEWRDILNYENIYQVSNVGRVRSLNRYVEYPNSSLRFFKGVILKHHFDLNGYCIVNLYLNKKIKHKKIHRLVAETFLKSNNNKDQVNHMDGNKQNNTLSNLEWVTCKQNIKHAEATGLRNSKGEGNARAKLTEKNVIKIRYLYSTGKYKQSELGEEFGVDQTVISSIVLYKTWKHI